MKYALNYSGTRLSSTENGKTWGPFLESLGNFSGLKSNIHIEI